MRRYYPCDWSIPCFYDATSAGNTTSHARFRSSFVTSWVEKGRRASRFPRVKPLPRSFGSWQRLDSRIYFGLLVSLCFGHWSSLIFGILVSLILFFLIVWEWNWLGECVFEFSFRWQWISTFILLFVNYSSYYCSVNFLFLQIFHVIDGFLVQYNRFFMQYEVGKMSKNIWTKYKIV